MYTLVDERIVRALDRDREFVTRVVKVVVNLFVGTGGVLVIVLGLIGLKTCGDVKKYSEAYARLEVRRRLDAVNSAKDYEERVANLYSQGLANLVLLEYRRGRADEHRIHLGTGDVDRLLAVLLASHTPDDVFRDAADALSLAIDDQLWPTVANRLLPLIQATGDGAWIKEKSERRRQLITLLAAGRSADIAAAVRALIVDDRETREVRSAAAEFSGAQDDLDAVPALEAIGSKESGAFQLAALEALGTVAPADQTFQAWVKTFDEGPADLERIESALSVAYALASAHVVDSTRSDDRAKVVCQLVQAVVRKGVRFKAFRRARESMRPDAGDALELRVYLPDAQQILPRKVPFEMLSGERELCIRGTLARAAADGMAQLAAAVDSLSVRAETRGERAAAVETELESREAAVVLGDGRSLVQDEVPDPIEIAPVTEKFRVDGPLRDALKVTGMEARWKDTTGQRRHHPIGRRRGQPIGCGGEVQCDPVLIQNPLCQ